MTKFIITMLWMPLLVSCGGNAVDVTLSPGPAGSAIDGDYRVPVVYLAEDEAALDGNYVRRMKHGGRDRYYEIHVPPSYRVEPTPVVMVLHGGGGYASVARYQSQMDAVSDANGFIVVYPAGTGKTHTDRLLFWNDEAKADGADDVAYIAAVLDDLPKHVRIDPNRVYATGMSNGAQMCFLLAARLSDRIAAFAPVAAIHGVNKLDPPRPVPLIYFHGTNDKFFPHMFVRASVRGWANFSGCTDAPTERRVGKATRFDYGCETVYWELEGGGHTWPGGKMTKLEQSLGVGEQNMDISASEEMWAFFKEHSK